MAPKATMRAYCQHCDATEVLAPEEIYSSEFNFWCPRCQSILILEDDGQNALPSVSVSEREAKTKEDDEPGGEVAFATTIPERDAPTKEDDDPPRGPLIETAAEPTPSGRASARIDPYAAFAAELDAGIGEPARALTPPRAFPTRDHKKTERDFKTSEVPLPPTRADAEGPDRDRTNGHAAAFPEATPEVNDVRALADIARNLDSPKATSQTSRRAPLPAARPATPADSGPVVARETVRVQRPEVQGEIAKRAIERRIGDAIRSDQPPLPNWDGGDTRTVRELARMAPPPETHEMPVADEAEEALPADDALENTPVVVPIARTTGLGSRTYERAELNRADAEPESTAEAPPPRPAAGGEDLDWYALIDEALPDEDPPLDLPQEDESRVVIRLPETMAVHSEADAEQVRQLQAKLEARGVTSPEETAHPVKKLDSKKVRDLTAEAGGDSGEDAGHTQVTEDETRDGFHKGAEADEYDTRDTPFDPDKTANDNTVKTRVVVDPDAPTTVTDKDRTAALRAEAAPPQPGSAKVVRAETGRTASDRRGRSPEAVSSGVVVEQFNPSDLDPGLVCARDPSSPEADYFKQLYQQIFHRRNGNGNGHAAPRVVLVTSARRGEGKTTVAANLALVGARMPGRGAALLIEADPRGGDLLRSFGLRMKVEGLLEALESGKDPAGFILQFKLGMLDVLPLGRPGSDAAELISSDRIGEVLRGLADRYPNSVVIIDGSSILHAPDPLALARHVDGVVLVVRADATPREQIERARDLIGPDKVLGVVLNQAGG
jgi:Mrp family chromosome partitioning ATPase